MGPRGKLNPFESIPDFESIPQGVRDTLRAGLFSGAAFAFQAGVKKVGMKRGAIAADFLLEVGKDVAGFAQGRLDANELPLRTAKNAARTAASWGLARVGAKAGFVIAGPAGALVGGVAGSALATFVSKNFLL